MHFPHSMWLKWIPRGIIRLIQWFKRKQFQNVQTQKQIESLLIFYERIAHLPDPDLFHQCVEKFERLERDLEHYQTTHFETIRDQDILLAWRDLKVMMSDLKNELQLYASATLKTFSDADPAPIHRIRTHAELKIRSLNESFPSPK